jgi:PleD family two-component response regulator
VPVIVVTIVTGRGAVAGFPVQDILPKPIDSEALLLSLRRAGLAPGRSEAILVVDDDAGSVKLVAATLAQLGYAAHGAGDGHAGLRIARESPRWRWSSIS